MLKIYTKLTEDETKTARNLLIARRFFSSADIFSDHPLFCLHFLIPLNFLVQRQRQKLLKMIRGRHLLEYLRSTVVSRA
jgi:hypothetical protein